MADLQGLVDRLIRHGINLGRYGKAETKDILAIIQEAQTGTMRRILAGISNAELETILNTIDKLYKEAGEAVKERIHEGVTAQAVYELENSIKMASQVRIMFDMPVPKTVIDRIFSTPADRGSLIDDLVSKFADGTREKIKAAIRQGITEGMSVSDMTKMILGEQVSPAKWIVVDGKKVLQPAVYRGGIAEMTERGADTLVRTITMHTYNAANAALYEENSDLIEAVMWVATLDFDTCEDCAALDGQTWKLDEGHPEPPYHRRCRCILTPVLKGVEPPRPQKYEDWLSGQPQSVQDDVLGKGRAEIFRSGTKLSDMTDKGSMLPLKDLKAKESEE